MRKLSIKVDDYVGDLDIETYDYIGDLDSEADDYIVDLDAEADDVRERLQQAWASGNIHEALGILVDDVRPRCVRWLLNRFSSISEEDGDGCFGDAVEGVYDRGPDTVRNVYNYVFTSAKNKTLNLVEERKHFVRLDPEWLEGANDDRLLVIAEAALDEELTVRVDQLRQLYSLTLPKLAPNRRRLALLLAERAELGNEGLERTMGMSKGALKSLKSRTLSDLRSLLPVVAEELGIDFEQVLSPTPEVLRVLPFRPSEDNWEGGE